MARQVGRGDMRRRQHGSARRADIGDLLRDPPEILDVLGGLERPGPADRVGMADAVLLAPLPGALLPACPVGDGRVVHDAPALWSKRTKRAGLK